VLPRWLKARLKQAGCIADRSALALLAPVNLPLALLLRRRVVPGSVLHISYMVHIPYHTVVHLRRQGVVADYLAIGKSPHWNRCDYNFVPSSLPVLGVLREFWTFWRVVARYEVVHAHFMYTLSRSGWELPVLKRMGRRLVVHFRGCEARDRSRNMALHPQLNICQDCDHHPPICQTASARRRREWARRFGDATLVTTPDLRDFVPDAIHFPFFAPDDVAPAVPDPDREFTIVHVTNQPGIEGTREIERAVERLRAQGRRVRFQWLHDLPHEQVMAAVAQADLAIGKMKMGYYANAQIESMAMGVPTITYVRDEFMTDELRRSGFIFATLPTLEQTIAHYLDHPEALAEKRRIARQSIGCLHDNRALAHRLAAIYRALGAEARASRRFMKEVPFDR
jgi:hypothetical protein